jgi:N utilization substance protein B
MGARTVGREHALMILFGVEITGEAGPTATRTFFSQVAPDSGFEADEEARAYAAQLVTGVTSKRDEIDDRIRRASTNWRLERMSRVDRNVLRLGVLELVEAVPRAVAIDEAVELAKRFGTEDSGAFVNGVLSKVADELG